MHWSIWNDFDLIHNPTAWYRIGFLALFVPVFFGGVGVLQLFVESKEKVFFWRRFRTVYWLIKANPKNTGWFMIEVIASIAIIECIHILSGSSFPLVEDLLSYDNFKSRFFLIQFYTAPQ